MIVVEEEEGKEGKKKISQAEVNSQSLPSCSLPIIIEVMVYNRREWACETICKYVVCRSRKLTRDY